MHYLALATDYDGTLATDGKVSDRTLAAMKRLRESGRKLILVTGRQLDDLRQTFPESDLFDCIVTENGALLYFPNTREEKPLGNPPPEQFVEALRSRQVEPLGVGKVIVATWQPHETAVLEAIRELGLELQIIFNKGAVMVLPPGVNKASGLEAALAHLELSPHNTAAVGDAENDHAFMDLCEVSVAVANALPAVKETADWVTQGSRGEGVVELIDRLVDSDLAEITASLHHHTIEMGTRTGGDPVHIHPYHTSMLITGTSGGGKSTLATGLLERLDEQGYQFCIIDPEGDYENFEQAIVLGNSQQAPNVSEILDLLSKPDRNVVVNLLAVKLDERPAFFAGLLPSLLELRSRTGRPHWLLIDEAHHMLPASWDSAALLLPQALSSAMLITVHPDQIAEPALRLIDTVVAVGQTPDQTIAAFCHKVDQSVPAGLPQSLESGEVLTWFCKRDDPFRLQIKPPHTERQRHKRNYAEGKLGEDKWFYFRGQDGKLNLKAQNLITFVQLAEGVDDETWQYHLKQQHYSKWFSEAIKDDALAQIAAEVEAHANLAATESRDRIIQEIQERYTLPA